MQFVKQAIAAALVTVVGVASAQNVDAPLKVSNNYLVWQGGVDYLTRIDALLTFNNVTFKGKHGGTPIEGNQAQAFSFDGTMRYNTELETPGKYNGSAKRRHDMCDISKASLSEPVMRIDAGWLRKVGSWFDDGIPKELEKDYEIFRREEANKIVIKARHPGAYNALEKLLPSIGKITEIAYEYVPAFNRKEYTLSWSSPSTVEKANMNVIPKSGAISKDVVELVAREARFLYTNILQAKSREDGEEWLLQAEDLDAMIHSSMKGSKFKGKVAVRASRVEGVLPEGATGEPITGWKLEFVEKMNGKNITYHSDIEFICETNDGTPHTVKLRPIGSRFKGELWLDCNYQMVRYGRLTCVNAKYEKAKMPRIANLNLELDEITADINFRFTYHQSVSAKGVGE